MDRQEHRELDQALPRAVPEGTVPFLAVEGSAYECGRNYAETVMREHPGYRRYLDSAYKWKTLPAEVAHLFDKRAPYIPNLFQGIIETAGPPQAAMKKPEKGACTSFGVCGSVTLDGGPISGQTKDTPYTSAYQYIVLRVRIKSAPTILVLAYPGEVLGYGMWSTGMSIFRNSLYSRGDAHQGLSLEQWGLLTLAGQSVHEGVELARKYGISGSGCALISDKHGESLSVEFNEGGVEIVPARNRIATHANHPVGERTKPYEHYTDEADKANSSHRMHRLWELLDWERGRLTPQKSLMSLADHAQYPRSICRHMGDDRNSGTSGAVIAEPTRGRLHVVRGNPCSNWPVMYTV